MQSPKHQRRLLSFSSVCFFYVNASSSSTCVAQGPEDGSHAQGCLRGSNPVPVWHKAQWMDLLHEDVGGDHVELYVLQEGVQHLVGEGD